MTNEQKFWNAIYNLIGETSRLVDIGALSDEDYIIVMEAVGMSIDRFREQQKAENSESGQCRMDGPTY